ncbi:MAG: ABC transporter permease [Bacteroidetes bacterium]|nr:ABC transporter permease [Bacteroidota bacterium]
MLIAYIKTAWRNILRSKIYSLLNVLGLAAGMAVALLIGLWVQDQSSWDRWVPGSDRSYQVRFRFSDNGAIRSENHVCIPLSVALKNDIPEIEHTAMVFGGGGGAITVGDKKINVGGITAGEEFLQTIKFPLVTGKAEEALKQMPSIVLTESTARALFGSAEAAQDKIVGIYGDKLRVTAVMKDLPKNSTFQFGFIRPFSLMTGDGWGKAAVTNWADCYFECYASLKPGAVYSRVEPKFRLLVQKYSPVTYATFQRQVVMQPMTDWHLVTGFENGYPSGGLIDYIRLFSIVGVLVLLIACVNFMNLSTARSEKRAREVGVRKVIGGSRAGLIFQFLTESVIISGISGGLALLLVQLVLPGFNMLIGAQVAVPYASGAFWLLMLAYVLVTGLLAGSRPAFYLSSFQPVKVLKGIVGREATLPRKVLVVLQFTCSIALIISTVIIYQQIEYARNRPRGYDPNRLIFSNVESSYDQPGWRQEVAESGMVSNMTRCLSPASDIYSHNVIDNWPGRQPNEALTLAMNAMADTNYFKTMGVPFVAGRNFTGNYAVDTFDVVINEAAVRRMRLKEPIGATIHWGLANAPNNIRIIGVVKDVLTTSPFGIPEPTVYAYQPSWTWTYMIRLRPEVGTQAALAKLGAIFHKYNQDSPFQYHFVDENYARQFALELLIGKLAGIFAVLAIFISCLGLFGLAAYMAEQRTKEVGIRKVLGASVTQVLLLLSKDFVALVGLSCIIASPVAFYFAERWLSGYYYRISIGPWVFILSGLVAVLITLMTVSFQAIKAALMNPVKSLRSE